MRLAYADPPYLGQSHRYNHPDAGKWDNPLAHVDLMADLDKQFDGWALSCSTPSLRYLAARMPDGARIASWSKSFAAFKRNVRIAYTWEPVIFKPARDSSKDGAPVGRDHLVCPITLSKGLVGAKPPQFCRWVLTLLGHVPSDEVTDLFPGTGVMARTLEGMLA